MIIYFSLYTRNCHARHRRCGGRRLEMWTSVKEVAITDYEHRQWAAVLVPRSFDQRQSVSERPHLMTLLGGTSDVAELLTAAHAANSLARIIGDESSEPRAFWFDMQSDCRARTSDTFYHWMPQPLPHPIGLFRLICEITMVQLQHNPAAFVYNFTQVNHVGLCYFVLYHCVKFIKWNMPASYTELNCVSLIH